VVHVAETSRYRFGPLEQHGVLLGLSLGQVAVLGSGLLSAFGFILLFRSPLLAIGAGLAAIALAFVPVAGRTLEAWAPVASRHAARRATGRHRWTSTAPASGHRVIRGRGRRATIEAPIALPPLLQGLAIETVADRALLPADVPAGVGMVRDRRAGTYVAVLRAHGRAFALRDEAEQAQLVEGWAEVLAAMADADSPIARLQVVERTLPDTGDEAARYLQEEMRRPVSDALVRSYLDLLDNAAPASREHETLIALQVDARRIVSLIRQFGDQGLAAYVALVQELSSLSERLQAAAIGVEGALPPRLLAEAIRVAFDPEARVDMARRALGRPDEAGCEPAAAWPLAVRDDWLRYRSDGAWHAVFWVREWPRVEVRPDFLRPLLLRTRAQRTVSIVMEPVPPERAQREVERRRTHALSDRETKERQGFMTSARREHELQQVLTREEELAEGHEELRFTGYVAVTAASECELELACKEVRRQASRSKLQLVRLAGEQASSFACVLPLCRGGLR
jgi:hypothetical protein